MACARVLRFLALSSVVVWGAAANSACIAVQTRLTGDLIVDLADAGPGAHEHYTYEAVESHVMAPIAMACVVTALFYGGACWAYLAAPFDDQEAAAIASARKDVNAIGACAHLISWSIEAVGWDARPREAAVRTLNGDRIALSDAKALCTRRRAAPPEKPKEPKEQPRDRVPEAAPQSTHDPADSR